MKVRYWGVRGSIPVPGSSTVQVGGNTPCVSIELHDGSLVIVDGGTGLRNLGRHLLSQHAFASGNGSAALLISHRHWDHIHGIPFFEPAYVRGNRFEIYFPASATAGDPLEDNAVSVSYSPANFPVSYTDIKAAYRFHIAEENVEFRVGSATIRPVRLNHPGTVLGYVVSDNRGGDHGAAKVAYLTDTGPWEGPLLGDGMDDRNEPHDGRHAAYRLQVASAIQGADLVIHDTFFENRGYAGRAHWGHSAPRHALSLCRSTHVRRLHLFHFAPDLDDDSVARMEAEARADAGPVEVAAAIEGLEIVLP